MTQLLSPAWQQQAKANRQFVMLFMGGQGLLEMGAEAKEVQFRQGRCSVLTEHTML